MKKLRVSELQNGGDSRGASFTVSLEILSFLQQISDIHVATVLPGAIRGNHFHTRRREVVVVLHQSDWNLHWDEGEGTLVQGKAFSGSGAQVILIEPGSSHAVENIGTEMLTIFGLSPEAYDPQETIRRVVI